MTCFYPLSALRATSPEGGSKICLCERSEAISREGGKKYVIQNGVKDPTEEVRRLCFGTLVVGYFAYAHMT